MSYKGGNAAHDQQQMSNDFGIIILRSHDTKSAGKGPHDGQCAMSHKIYVNDIALSTLLGGLGFEALDLAKVAQRFNRDHAYPQKWFYSDHTTGPRFWYAIDDDVYDEHRAFTPVISPLVTQFIVKSLDRIEFYRKKADKSLGSHGLTRGYYCYLTFPKEKLVTK